MSVGVYNIVSPDGTILNSFYYCGDRTAQNVAALDAIECHVDRRKQGVKCKVKHERLDRNDSAV